MTQWTPVFAALVGGVDGCGSGDDDVGDETGVDGDKDMVNGGAGLVEPTWAEDELG